MNVVKLDWDVAYVAMVVYLCCKHLSLMFHMFFQTYVASVFIWKLHMFQAYVVNVFYLDIAYILQRFSSFLGVFASVSYTCFKCFICFLTYVAFIASGCLNIRSSVAAPSLSFCCLASMSSARRRRQSPLVWTGPMCLQADTTDKMWAGRRGTRDVGVDGKKSG
jgi:hypothetical protein